VSDAHIEVKAAAADLQQQMDALSDRIAAAGEVAAAVMRRIGEQLRAASRTMYAVAWASYREAGMPYGESTDGLLRWARERQQIRELRAEADRIEAMHATCATLRAKRGGER
jgi:hypothetical protein